MLDKLSGRYVCNYNYYNVYNCNVSGIIVFTVQAPKPSAGPHKTRECIPMIVFLRNRLKYALTGDEVKKIVKQRLIKVDGKVRTDVTYPAGFMGRSLTGGWGWLL